MDKGTPIYIPDFDAMGERHTLYITCDNWDLFFRLCSQTERRAMLDTCIEQEDYEMAEMIKQYIIRTPV